MAGGRVRQDRPREGEGRQSAVHDPLRGCHNTWPYTWTEPTSTASASSWSGWCRRTYVGTDPEQFETCVPTRSRVSSAKSAGAVTRARRSCRRAISIRDAAASHPRNRAVEAQAAAGRGANLHGYREYPLPPPPEGVYKAAPRDGVWATPPFMHNGSVPNLYEMLIPAEERTKKFYVGREFDPVKVGTGHQRRLREIPDRHDAALETRTPVTPSRTARAATASSARC